MRTQFYAFGALSLFLTPQLLLSAQPTLDEIHDDLKSWREQFSTIQVEYFSWCEKDVVDYVPDYVPGTTIKGVHGKQFRFGWSDIDAFYTEMAYLRDSHIVGRQYRGNDGRRPWTAETKLNDPNFWFKFHLGKPTENGRPVSNLMVEALYGLYDPGRGMWLDEIIAENYDLCQIIEHEENLVVLSLVNETGATDFYFDLKQHALPTKRINWTKNKEKREQGWTWVLETHSEVPEGFLFPKSGTLSLANEPSSLVNWEVESVALNTPLTRVDFQAPKPHVGTKIYDAVKGESTWHGAKKRNSISKTRAATATQQDGTGEIAHPRKAIVNIRWLLLSTALILLSIGGIKLFRASASRWQNTPS